ncbi:hypothetical protein NL676_005633 [Syzygium grande]|nr:hypothetical protein NL676_005633 [Syzygium grande]
MGWTEPYVIKPGGFSFKKLLSSTSLECIPITIQFLFNKRKRNLGHCIAQPVFLLPPSSFLLPRKTRAPAFSCCVSLAIAGATAPRASGSSSSSGRGGAHFCSCVQPRAVHAWPDRRRRDSAGPRGHMMPCWSLGDRIRRFLRDYDSLQSLAVVLIYIQIGCALVGSLGAIYNGILLINLAIALFALVAIESSSQKLGRTYAVLLFCAILLDISWFILFTYEIWNISSDDYGVFFIFSVKLALAMQISGFSVRLSSSFLWIQIYRLGVSRVDSAYPHEVDTDSRTSFLSPVTPAAVRQGPDPDEILGGSIYDPSYYSSLFEDGQGRRLSRVDQSGTGDDESLSAAEASELKTSVGRSFQDADVNSSRTISQHEIANKPQSV